jgi:undecaprenyl-diphosphatase
MIRILANNVYDFDIFLCRKLAHITGKAFLDRLMRWVSKSGDGYLYGALGLTVILLDRTNGMMFLAAGSVAFAIELLIQKGVKHLVRRERPDGRVTGLRHLVEPPDRFSFPSGHTAGAFLTVTLLAGLYPVSTMPLYLWASAVGFSRVYNGVHYPTDVFTGSILGIISAWAGLAIVM